MTETTSLASTNTVAPADEIKLSSTASVATKSALRYLGQLCKHFGHKVPASIEGDHGWIAFDFGRCHLAANDEELSLHNAASTMEGLERLEKVIASHLERFAFREELTITWQRED
ncbi:MAG TPA: DUF2218 domain-containing protein [Terriglobales bacterium]|nr:DUF2218 domain-containing protein [Terriglobales bacterium]